VSTYEELIEIGVRTVGAPRPARPDATRTKTIVSFAPAITGWSLWTVFLIPWFPEPGRPHVRRTPIVGWALVEAGGSIRTIEPAVIRSVDSAVTLLSELTTNRTYGITAPGEDSSAEIEEAKSDLAFQVEMAGELLEKYGVPEDATPGYVYKEEVLPLLDRMVEEEEDWEGDLACLPVPDAFRAAQSIRRDTSPATS